MENDKFVEKYFDSNDDTGFNQVLFERQKKLEAIRERLKRYELTEFEINKLFDIIIDAEIKMEEIKRGFKAKNCNTNDLDNFYDKLIEIQNKMKNDFDSKLIAILKNKYEKAKKILKEQEDKRKST